MWYYSDAKSNYTYSTIVLGHMEIVIYTQEKYQTIKSFKRYDHLLWMYEATAWLELTGWKWHFWVNFSIYSLQFTLLILEFYRFKHFHIKYLASLSYCFWYIYYLRSIEKICFSEFKPTKSSKMWFSKKACSFHIVIIISVHLCSVGNQHRRQLIFPRESKTKPQNSWS